MKRPAARPLYSVLLLTIFAVTITCRVLLRRGLGLGLGSSPLDIDSKSFPQYQVPVFNSTLLRFAEIDIGEPKLKQEVEQLLEGNFASRARYRTFATWRRYNRYDASSKASTRRIPATLRSPLFYRYWLDVRKNLHDWGRIRRFQDDIMLDLVRLVKHPLDKHNGNVVSNRKYASCAVVGNSGILLENEHGPLIDSHEMVIRLNNARIGGFERNVGSKTTVSLVNSNILHLCARKEGCFCHPYGNTIPIIMYICQPVHFLDYTICNSSHKAPLMITDPRFDILCSRIAKYYSLKRFAAETGKPLEDWSCAHDGANFHYSSGMQAIMLALGVCDKVSVFGFGKSETAKHHYHTNQKGELLLHDYAAEYVLYDDLIHRPWALPFVSKAFKFPPVVMYK